MRGLAKELLELRPDVILAATGPGVSAARQQTFSIPIVFVQVPRCCLGRLCHQPCASRGQYHGFYKHGVLDRRKMAAGSASERAAKNIWL
jgi:hypothetical protein